MTSPPDDTTTDTSAIIAALRIERDAALAREAALAEELAARSAELADRKSEFDERIEHQSATIDVLKAMSASPGDAQPVFDLIARQAANQCNVPTTAVATFDGTMMHLASESGLGAAYVAQFPRPVGLDFSMGRAVLNRRVDQVEDITAYPGHSFVDVLGHWSVMAVPMLRHDVPLGAITIGRPAMGPFSASQVALLQTFAEQAVIAITSAETYRALQTRTSDLQQSLEYQTATSDVLKVISRSTFDLQLVLDALSEAAARLCEAEMAWLTRREGETYRFLTAVGSTPELTTDAVRLKTNVLDRHTFVPGRQTITGRVASEAQAVQIVDIVADPEYTLSELSAVAKMRTLLGVPMMREGVVVGTISLARQRVEPFTEKQIGLVQTFADQAVIAMENARLLGELRQRTSDLQESLEYQTATSDVLKVISRTTFDLQPVLDTVVETAASLCDADQAAIFRIDGSLIRLGSNFGFPAEYEAHHKALGEFPINPHAVNVGHRTANERRIVHIHDVAAIPAYPDFAITLGKQRTALGVPLLREGEAIGVIVLARQRVAPFTDRQIELVSTFADQAVIAMENARLITEQREALEQQTATAEVLQVINASPGDLTPVFDAMLEKACHLCEAEIGTMWVYEDEHMRASAIRGAPLAYAEFLRRGAPHPMSREHKRLLSGERFIHTADLTDTETYRSGHPVYRAAGDFGGVRTFLGVPLRKDEQVLGHFGIYRQEVRPFTDKQIALLQSFAAQAVIAMENARLITEQREALEQQTATTEVLQVINASPGNLTPVFDAMLEKAMRLCGAAFGLLRGFDGEFVRALATRGLPEALSDFSAQTLLIPPPDTTMGRALRTGRPEEDLDIRETDVYKSGVPGPRAIADLGGARTILYVPLVKDQVSVGLFTFYRQEVRPFSDKQIALLKNFAAQAVIAMENARLLTETREALEQQTATADVLQVINGSPGDLEPVFETLLDRAMRLCGANFGEFQIFDGEGLRLAAFNGVPGALAEFRRNSATIPTPGPTTHRMRDGANVIHTADLMAEDAYREGNPHRRALVDLGGARTVLAVALRKDDKLLGAINIYRQEVKPFSDRQVALLQSFAAQAIIAMENARLLTETREALEQQTATAEVLQVINANPGDLAPVFDAMLTKAMHLCDAAFGGLWTFEGQRYVATALRGVPAAYAEFLANTEIAPPGPGTAAYRFRQGERTVIQSIDLAAEEPYRVGEPNRRAVVDLGGARTALQVPLYKDDAVLGVIMIYRQEVRPFTDKQIALLQNFAAQAVIAMENARLLDELRQRQEELRITFENMGDGVAMFDETQRLVAWNRNFQDILDVPDDIIARRQTFSEYVRYLAERGEYGPGADPEEQIRRLTEQVGQYRSYERTRPDGRVIDIRHNPVPSGGFVLIFSDITERKRNEAEIHAARDAAEEASRTIEAAYRELKTAQANLIQAEKMASLGQLTAGIAHEIKNPLNFVNNFSALSTELIDELRDVLAPEPLGETARTEVDDLTALLKANLEKVVQHGQRADGIVRSMLDHSRGSSGERRTVDLNAVIDEALNLAYHGARAQDQSFNITLERDFGEGIAPIEVNPQDITRVFLNLFANGFYAVTRRTRGDGDAGFMPTLKVTTIDAGGAVEIRVRDNGAGIPADIRDKLFQPFFTTKPTGEGTGLGLSITYDIVTQQHGGSIAVDSKVGEYSEFTIQLPRQP